MIYFEVAALAEPDLERCRKRCGRPHFVRYLESRVAIRSHLFPPGEGRLTMMIPEREIPLEQLLPQRPDMELMFSNAVLADKQSRNETIRHAYLEYGYQ